MQKGWFAVGAAAAAITAVGGVHYATRAEHERDKHESAREREREHEEEGESKRSELLKPDSRMRRPGTHRARAEELATRNRVALEESRKLRAKLTPGVA